MISLTREVRFGAIPEGEKSPVSNSWGGWPSMTAVAPWLAFRCTLNGELDPVSGYLCNIKLIDNVLRDAVAAQLTAFQGKPVEVLLCQTWEQVCDSFPEHCHVEQLQVSIGPTLEYSLQPGNEIMIQLTQQFEFSASHRLHNPDLSDEENQALFGKCNNPHGHGHNYVVAVSVAGQPDDNGVLVPLDQFELLVKRQVIDRMDHRYLNVELDEFRVTNPSVENIAIVIWNLLASSIDALGNRQARLDCVRVYETPKTWADYRGPR